ncbi:hypothetical protein ACIQ57_14845 [Lysinibacillus xylanilyticus]
MRKRSANVASATNVLSARKRSVSGKCFICAKATTKRPVGTEINHTF